MAGEASEKQHSRISLSIQTVEIENKVSEAVRLSSLYYEVESKMLPSIATYVRCWYVGTYQCVPLVISIHAFNTRTV